MFITRGLGTTSTVTPGVQAIANTIIQTEGVNPAYAPNNNPGNLVYVGQSGATKGAGGFAKFPTYDDGVNALYNQINIYSNQGLTVSEMMNKYAPSTASNDPTGVNNPNLYTQYVANALGTDPNTPVSTAISNYGSIDPTTDLPMDSSATILGLDPTTVIITGLAALATLYAIK